MSLGSLRLSYIQQRNGNTWSQFWVYVVWLWGLLWFWLLSELVVDPQIQTLIDKCNFISEDNPPRLQSYAFVGAIILWFDIRSCFFSSIYKECRDRFQYIVCSLTKLLTLIVNEKKQILWEQYLKVITSRPYSAALTLRLAASGGGTGARNSGWGREGAWAGSHRWHDSDEELLSNRTMPSNTTNVPFSSWGCEVDHIISTC